MLLSPDRYLKGELRFFRKLFRKLVIGVYPYNGDHGAGTMQPLNKALSVFISPIL